MKEFNLEEFKKDPSQKVVTRDGRTVRIICTDAKGDEPIVALLYNKIRDEENVYTYNRDGYFYENNDSCLDLFFAPIKREGWVNLYKDRNGAYSSNFIFETEKRAKEVIGEKHTTYLTTIKIAWEE